MINCLPIVPTVTTEWILALETSVTNATLLLARNGQVFAHSSFISERSQECDLYAPLQDLLSQIPDNANLSAIIIGTGPGSYNGARVGIATAQAIAHTHKCRVAGLCSFEAVPEISQSKTAWAIGDARRGSFFLMEIMNGRAQTPPQLLEKEDFLKTLTNCPGPKITFESPDRLPAGIDCIQSHSTSEGLLQAWLNRSEAEKEALLKLPSEAFYLRPPHITKSKKK